MKQEFVPYELAVKLKALGFDEPCLGLYYPNGKFNIKEQNGLNCDSDKNSYLDSLGNSAGFCTAPLYQQVFRWFREEYNLNSFVIDSKSYNWYFNINDTIKDDVVSEVLYFKTYEEAELACLTKLIEIVENKEE